MLGIEVKTEAIQKRVEAMIEHVKMFGHDDMPQTLTDWQVQDMRRKYPEIETEQVTPEEYNASTVIYPRSRTYEQTHPHRARPIARRKTALSSMPRLIKSVIRHPILRPVLFDLLHSRMVASISEKLKWR